MIEIWSNCHDNHQYYCWHSINECKWPCLYIMQPLLSFLTRIIKQLYACSCIQCHWKVWRGLHGKVKRKHKKYNTHTTVSHTSNYVVLTVAIGVMLLVSTVYSTELHNIVEKHSMYSVLDIACLLLHYMYCNAVEVSSDVQSWKKLAVVYCICSRVPLLPTSTLHLWQHKLLHSIIWFSLAELIFLWQSWVLFECVVILIEYVW